MSYCCCCPELNIAFFSPLLIPFDAWMRMDWIERQIFAVLVVQRMMIEQMYMQLGQVWKELDLVHGEEKSCPRIAVV